MLDNLDADTPKTDTAITASGNGKNAAGQRETRVDLESGGGEVFSAKPVQKTVKDHLLGLFCNGKCTYNL